MEISPDLENSLAAPQILLPPAWDKRLAGWISNVLSPPVLAVLGLLLVAYVSESVEAWLWGIYYLVLGVFVPMVYIAWKVHRGEITDFHMRIRKQRIQPMSLMLACALAAWLGMWIGAAPWVFTLMAGIGVFQAAFLLLVTLRWKISGHSVAVASLTVFLYGLLGDAAAPGLLFIPLVAWARIRLNRHDLA